MKFDYRIGSTVYELQHEGSDYPEWTVEDIVIHEEAVGSCHVSVSLKRTSDEEVWEMSAEDFIDRFAPDKSIIDKYRWIRKASKAPYSL